MFCLFSCTNLRNKNIYLADEAVAGVAAGAAAFPGTAGVVAPVAVVGGTGIVGGRGPVFGMATLFGKLLYGILMNNKMKHAVIW